MSLPAPTKHTVVVTLNDGTTETLPDVEVRYPVGARGVVLSTYNPATGKVVQYVVDNVAKIVVTPPLSPNSNVMQPITVTVKLKAGGNYDYGPGSLLKLHYQGSACHMEVDTNGDGIADETHILSTSKILRVEK